MILVDTGPLVALFNRADPDHAGVRALLATFREPIVTTLPVLTEAIHLLDPGSTSTEALCEMITPAGATLV